MGTLVTRAIEEAGFADVADRALQGSLTPDDLKRLSTADTLVLSAIADQVREKFHGDEVTLVATRSHLPVDVDAVVVSTPQRVDATLLRANGTVSDVPTGEEGLRAIALARLSTPVSRAVAVSWDHIGLHLAQTALIFGANVLFGGIGNRGSRDTGQHGVLPLADNPGVRKQEITGLVERALRQPQWVETAQAQLESRS